jgi:hypothetical protein
MANTSTVSAAYSSSMNVTETFSIANAADNSILVTSISETGTLTASTTIPATVQSQFSVTLSSGTGSINLAAIPGLNASETIDATGLKLQLFKFANPITNANTITVAKGASNGYGLSAAGGTWSVILSPGQSVMVFSQDVAPDVASGARVIDVTGTGSQVLNVGVVLG